MMLQQIMSLQFTFKFQKELTKKFNSGRKTYAELEFEESNKKNQMIKSAMGSQAQYSTSTYYSYQIILISQLISLFFGRDIVPSLGDSTFCSIFLFFFLGCFDSNIFGTILSCYTVLSLRFFSYLFDSTSFFPLGTQYFMIIRANLASSGPCCFILLDSYSPNNQFYTIQTSLSWLQKTFFRIPMSCQFFSYTICKQILGLVFPYLSKITSYSLDQMYSKMYFVASQVLYSLLSIKQTQARLILKTLKQQFF